MLELPEAELVVLVGIKLVEELLGPVFADAELLNEQPDRVVVVKAPHHAAGRVTAEYLLYFGTEMEKIL